MAANGLRESTAAKALGMRLLDFRNVIRNNEYARDLWEDAKAIERDKLLDTLYNRAIEGDSKAAQFLLAARHGLTDKTPDSAGERVHITFQLPAAMDPEKYLEALQVHHHLPTPKPEEALP
jgi:hypothetical protein